MLRPWRLAWGIIWCCLQGYSINKSFVHDIEEFHGAACRDYSINKSSVHDIVRVPWCCLQVYNIIRQHQETLITLCTVLLMVLDLQAAPWNSELVTFGMLIMI